MRVEWLRWTKRLTAPLQLERQALRLPKATGITRDITIGITVRTMIGVPAPTTGRTIGSTGIGGTAGITAHTMDPHSPPIRERNGSGCHRMLTTSRRPF